jgi:hypothetical protein
VLTHLDKSMDYATLSGEVPPHVLVGYDGLEIIGVIDLGYANLPVSRGLLSGAQLARVCGSAEAGHGRQAEAQDGGDMVDDHLPDFRC